MAEPAFDRGAFSARLATRRLGRHLLVRAEVESTNDVAWEALAAGAPDGTTVVADRQTRGRGRAGRRWHTAPGRGLALSVVMFPGCERGRLGALPLAAGLALARALERLGAAAELRWPNDLTLGGRKVAGILCESRRDTAGGDVVVIGTGLNVAQRAEDFPAELAAGATSLALEDVVATREAAAAEFLNALEPLWDEMEEGGRERVLEAWKARAGFWGRPVAVRTAGGEVTGIARDLDPEGALLLALPEGGELRVLAGDLVETGPARVER